MKSKTIVANALILMALISLTFCGGKKEHDHNAEVAAAEPVAESASTQFDVSADFQNQLSATFTSYVSLKEAFVATNVVDVKLKAAATEESLKEINMSLLSDEAHHTWMEYFNQMVASLKSIQSSDDIEEQRESFSKLSDNLYKSIKAYGLNGTTAYYEFCPMAFNDQGGYWLSDSEKIRNPYFGDKMLSCGKVEETIN